VHLGDREESVCHIGREEVYMAMRQEEDGMGPVSHRKWSKEGMVVVDGNPLPVHHLDGRQAGVIPQALGRVMLGTEVGGVLDMLDTDKEEDHCYEVMTWSIYIGRLLYVYRLT